MPGALAGAQLRIVIRSATRSATPKIEAERGRSATPVFAGALMLCYFFILSTFFLNLQWPGLDEFLDDESMKSFLLLWSSCLKGVLFIKHSYQCFMATRGPVEHNNTQRRRRNRIPFFLPSSSSLFYWFLLLPFSLPIFAFLAKKMLTSAFLWLAIKKVRFILRDSQVKVQTNSEVMMKNA